jgi:polysaccharide biosynthesis protein PslH
MSEDVAKQGVLCVVTDQLPYPPRNGITLPLFNYLEIARKRGEVSVILLENLIGDPVSADALAQNERRYGPIMRIALMRRSAAFRLWSEVSCVAMFQHGWYPAEASSVRLDLQAYDLLLVSPMSAVAKWCVVCEQGVVQQPRRTVAAVNDCTAAEFRYRALGLSNGLRGRFKAMIDRLRAPIIGRIEARLLREFSAVFVQTHADKAAMARLVDAAIAGRCVLVPNGVDAALFDVLPSTSRKLLFVGELSGEYGPVALWLCRELWPMIQRQFPDSELILVGRGASPELQAVLSNAPGVRYISFAESLSDVYATAGVVLSPVYKGFGLINKTIEGMAAGLPVVGGKASFNGISGFRPGVHGVVIETMRASDYAMEIARLLADPAAARNMGESARGLVREQFHWGRVGLLFADLPSCIDTGSVYVGSGVGSHLSGVESLQ